MVMLSYFLMRCFLILLVIWVVWMDWSDVGIGLFDVAINYIKQANYQSILLPFGICAATHSQQTSLHII